MSRANGMVVVVVVVVVVVLVRVVLVRVLVVKARFDPLKSKVTR